MSTKQWPEVEVGNEIIMYVVISLYCYLVVLLSRCTVISLYCYHVVTLFVPSEANSWVKIVLNYKHKRKTEKIT